MGKRLARFGEVRIVNEMKWLWIGLRQQDTQNLRSALHDISLSCKSDFCTEICIYRQWDFHPSLRNDDSLLKRTFRDRNNIAVTHN